MGLSNKLFCEAGSFSCCPSTPTGVFIPRFEALFPPTLEPWVAWSASLPRCSSGLSMHTCGAIESASHHLVGSACCSLACPVPQSSTSLGLPATLSRVLSTPAAHLCPSYQSDECFFFISLVVGLPYSSIFCQFWLFFVFKFVVVLLLVVQGGPVCLPMPPSWLEVPNHILIYLAFLLKGIVLIIYTKVLFQDFSLKSLCFALIVDLLS